MYYRSKHVEILYSKSSNRNVLWFRLAIPFTYTVLSIEKANNLIIKLNTNLYWLRVDGWYKDLGSRFSYRCSRWMIYKEKTMSIFRPEELYVIPKD